MFVVLSGFNLLAARGQTPATMPVQHSISLEVQQVASGGGGIDVNKTKSETGKYVGTNGGPLATTTLESKSVLNHRTVLSVAVRNFSTQPDAVQLEYYFFAQSVAGGKEYLLNSDTSKISLAGGETQTVNATSKEVATTTTQKLTGADGYSTIMSQQKTGEKLKGWMVRIMADGKVLQVRGSDMKYEDYGRDDNALKAMPNGPPSKTR